MILIASFPPNQRRGASRGGCSPKSSALPILSPHGHSDPAWFAFDQPFQDAVSLFLWPDHYILRLLFSQGVSLESLGLRPRDDAPFETDRRAIWRRFAEQYRLFRGTPSRLWLDHVFAEVFRIEARLEPETADTYFDIISAALAEAAFRPRALFERFGIEVLATTEGALDPLHHHRAIRASGWPGRVITTFRPDDVVDPDREDFVTNLQRLGELTGEDTQPLERLSRRARCAPRLLPRPRGARNGPRPSDRADGRPHERRGAGPVRPHPAAGARNKATPSCSAPRC